ncbi:4-hydroxy-tetrahydrodipicolinate synthase, partial [Singulisphaera rosea]
MPSTKGRIFAGCTVALVTPFRDGDVDYQALKDAVDWQIAQGTPVISPVGTTGESPTLSHDEHEKVITAVVERAAGRAKVLPGTGSNATAEAVRLTKFAAKAGADGALLVSPYYNRPTQEGLYAHYARIAESVDLPLVLYNVPGRTGRNVDPETVERLAKSGPIVAVKEASGSLDQVS